MRPAATLFSIVALGWLGLGLAHAQLYFSDSYTSVVSECDSDSGAVLNPALVMGLDAPRGMAVADGFLYIVESNRVGKYDAVTGAVINDALVTGLDSPMNVAVVGKVLYVTSQTRAGRAANSGTVGKYDAETGVGIDAWFVPNLINPNALSVAEGKLFVACGKGRSNIAEYDAETGAQITADFAPLMPNVSSLAQSGSSLWVLSSAVPPAGIVAKYDVNTGAEAYGFTKPHLTGVIFPNIIAMTGDAFYVTTSMGAIRKYNASTGDLISEVFAKGRPYAISGMAVTPRAGSILGSFVDEIEVGGRASSDFQALVNQVVLILCLVEVALVFLFFGLRQRQRSIPPPLPILKKMPDLEPAVAAIPVPVVAESKVFTTRSALLVCCLILALVVGGYLAFEAAISAYINGPTEHR